MKTNALVWLYQANRINVKIITNIYANCKMNASIKKLIGIYFRPYVDLSEYRIL